jgi:hypothetical protein
MKPGDESLILLIVILGALCGAMIAVIVSFVV